MDLRGHLDDETLGKLSAMASVPKPTHRAAPKPQEKYDQQIVEPLADEKRRLAKAKTRIERRERKKAAKNPTSAKAKTQLKPASKNVGKGAKRPRKSSTSAADRKLNGLSVPKNAASVVRQAKKDPLLEVMPAPAPVRAVRESVQQSTAKFRPKPFNPKPNEKIRSSMARGRLAVTEERFLKLCGELAVIVRRDSRMDYITGSDFEKLRLHVARQSLALSAPEELSFEEKLRLTSGTSQWKADGTPLKRYESQQVKRIKEAPRSSAPFIQVVSGGLPTLGKGRK